MQSQGQCDARFQPVRDEFERNFRERGEVGASVCLILDGKPVVDLWGGAADRAGRPWERDTLGVVWSCTKAAVALCAHVLVARGQLDLDAPVARYWPEFARNGKEAITLKLLLTHQAGLPAIRQPLRPGGLYDWDYMVHALAAEAPFWPPGTRQGYHAATFGHLVGEVVRRVSGQPLDQFFREQVSGPLGLDFHLGLPASEEGRVAATIRADAPPRGEVYSLFAEEAQRDPQSIQGLILRNTGRNPGVRDYDTPEAHQAVLPSQGGITNARGLAGMYAPLALGGTFQGVELVDRGTLSQLGAAHAATASDAVLLIGLRCGLGFWKAVDNRAAPPGGQESLLLSEAAFGHPGMGGSLGFADPQARLAFGYTMNKQGRGVSVNDRGQSLVDAAYRCLGYQSNRYGHWM